MAESQISLRSAGWVSLLSLLQLLVQFAFQVLLAKHFGAGAEMDAFVAAISLPTVVSAILFGSLAYAFVPVFSQQLVAGDQAAAWSTANGLLLLLAAGALSAAGLMGLFARPLSIALFPGFVSSDAELTAHLLRILCWLIVTNGLIAFAQAVHHSQRRFLVPAWAPVAGTAVTYVMALVWHGQGMQAIAWAVLAGSAVAALVQMGLPLRGFRVPRRVEPALQRFVWLALPLVCGAVYFRLDPLVDRYLGSTLPTGSVSHLGYAWRLTTALLLVSSGGLSVVAFPNFALRHAAGGMDELAGEVAYALRGLSALVIPIVVGLAVYSPSVIQDLFERGRFVADDTRAVALLLRVYLGMVAGAALGEVIAKTFYALSDTRTPTIIGCLGFTLGLVLKLVFTPRIGVLAIAWATSVYYLLIAVVMGWLLSRQLGGGMFSGLAASAGRALGASMGSVLLVWPLVHSGLPAASLFAAALGAVVYFVLMLWQGDEIARRLWVRLRGAWPVG